MDSDARDEIRLAIREIIESIKPLKDGVEEIPYGAPLFKDDSGQASPVELDSLDTLDLVLAIGERFRLDEEQIDRMMGGDVDLKSLRTINDIADFILASALKISKEPAPSAPRADSTGGRAN